MEPPAESAPPAEAAVKLLLEYLVDPMLPLRPKSPSLGEKQSVAKQMHAVVMLYNYYHRKQHPEAEFLDYKSFCKLAVSIRPVLSTHMNLANLTEEALANDWGKQPSLTEKAIMDACNIASSLEAHGDVQNVEEWPLAKVSVLLVDSKAEKCLLLFSSITSGTWSPPEISINDREAKGSRFEHFAFAAIKKATGIHMSKLAVLENFVVYCLNKEKAAAYFFIMLCTEPSKNIEVPIQDAIESMDGPLLKWISGGWALTQVAEYYDVLPYATIISSWYSRRDFSKISEVLSSSEKGDRDCSEKTIMNDLENSNVALGSIDGNSSLLPKDSFDGDGRQVSDINEKKGNSTKSRGNGALTHDKPKPKRKYEMKNPRRKTRLLTLEDLENGKTRETMSPDNTMLRELESEEREKSSKPLKNIEPEVVKLGKCIDESLDINQITEENLETGTNLKETSGTDNSHRVETDIQETENSDKSHNNKQLENCINLDQCHQNTKTSDKPWDSNDSEQYSPNDLQRIHSPARKKQKMDSVIRLLTNESDKEVPTCVYCHLKQKIPLASGGLTTGAATQGGETSLASVVAMRNQALTKTALGVLYNKREKLVHQQRILDSEIAHCDQNIHKILEGKEDCLAVKLDAIINGCKDMLQKDMTSYEDHQDCRREA